MTEIRIIPNELRARREAAERESISQILHKVLLEEELQSVGNPIAESFSVYLAPMHFSNAEEEAPIHQREEEKEERARKEAQNQEAELRWLKGRLQGYCKAIENQLIELSRAVSEEERARKEAQNQISESCCVFVSLSEAPIHQREEEKEERARKEAQNQMAEKRRLEEKVCFPKVTRQISISLRRSRIDERVYKETENQMAEKRRLEEKPLKKRYITFRNGELCRDEGEWQSVPKSIENQIWSLLPHSAGIEERAPKEARNQRKLFQDTSVEHRKNVGRMDDGFMKTFPPVISHQQNNFKPIEETKISGKDSGTGGKAQRRQWEGMESNSRKTDDRNILVTTAARGLEEVCPISSPFSLKNRGQKQGNGEDNVKKQTLILLTTGTVSRSPMGHETGRVDIYAGDKNLLNAGFRKEHGIHDIIAMQQISVPCDAANDSDVKFLVRMRPYGEGKDSWEHCTTQDGDVGLPEEQPLYISHILRGSSTFPASATWVLETPDKSTPSSTLEAVLEIKLVTGDSMVPSKGSNVTSGNPVAELFIQVQGKELHDAVPDLERSDRQQSGITLEEKYQTEPMEK